MASPALAVSRHGEAYCRAMNTEMISEAPRVRRGRGPWFGAVLTLAVVALVSGAVVVGLGAAGLTPALTRRSAPDSGVQACVTMRDAPRTSWELSNDAVQGIGRQLTTRDTAQVLAQLAASRDEHLRQAGELMTAYGALPDDQEQRLRIVVATIGDVGAGCTAVGVALPADFFDVS